jgi:rod shape-determining protein MreD
MLTKLFLNTILILLIIILQLSFVKTLPLPLDNLNLVLGVVVFITLIDYQKALWVAFIFGLLMDIYSFKGFGLMSLGLILVVIIVNLLFKNLFTNRSLFSLLVLGIIATVFFEFLDFIFNHLYFYLKLATYPVTFSVLFFQDLFWQIVLNLVFLVFVFYFYRYLSKSYANLER